MALPDTPKLLTPPELGVARVRVPGFIRLTAAEQLRAAALALNRDLGVGAANLRLAVQPAAASSDHAWVAYTTHATAANTALSTQVFSALNTEKTYWMGAPGGYIVGAQGAVAVEAVDTDDGADDGGLPAIVVAMLGPRAGTSAGASECILVGRDRDLLSDETLALWQTGSGIAMVDGSFPQGSAARLVAAPSLQTVARSTTLDVALRYAAAAGVACVLIAAARLVTLPAASTTAANAAQVQKQPPPGALLDRIATISPDVLTRTQSATYASGAWVFSFSDALDATTQSQLQAAFAANGLQGQATGAPSPRLRVYRAP